jgi:hypothetical protein
MGALAVSAPLIIKLPGLRVAGMVPIRTRYGDEIHLGPWFQFLILVDQDVDAVPGEHFVLSQYRRRKPA